MRKKRVQKSAHVLQSQQTQRHDRLPIRFCSGQQSAYRHVRKISPQRRPGHPDFVQSAAIAAWSDDAHVRERNAIFAEKRRLVETFFQKHRVQCLASTATFYIWAQAPKCYANAEAFVAKLASTTGIIATPGDALGDSCDNWYRLALVPTAEWIKECLEIWDKAIASGDLAWDEKINEEELFKLGKTPITYAWDKPDAIQDGEVQQSLIKVLRYLERGELRVAAPAGAKPTCGDVLMDGNLSDWQVFPWVKQAILLSLKWRTAEPLGVIAAYPGESDSHSQGRVHGKGLTFFDKLDARSDYKDMGVRVVPPGVIREGAYVAAGCIVMPGYVNIGAYVNKGTMVDTWATVGSCAQIGRGVHLSGGVGIGGVLEPPGAKPVIIGDNAFIGSRAIVVEGVVVESGAVIGANVCLTASTPIYDVTTPEKRSTRGLVPHNAVVAPGTHRKTFPVAKCNSHALTSSHIVTRAPTKKFSSMPFCVKQVCLFEECRHGGV